MNIENYHNDRRIPFPTISDYLCSYRMCLCYNRNQTQFSKIYVYNNVELLFTCSDVPGFQKAVLGSGKDFQPWSTHGQTQLSQ